MLAIEKVVDVDLFKGLDHETLAMHVFPGSFGSNGKDLYAARKNCFADVVEMFKNNLQLKVRIAPPEWCPDSFSSIDGNQRNANNVHVPRCNLATKNHCILYCGDCVADGNICSPVAKLSFTKMKEKSNKKSTTVNVAGTVNWLFFHNCHSCRDKTETVFQSGFCILPTPCEFITGGIYNKAIHQGRKLLHNERGVRKGSILGLKEKSTDEEMMFEYVYEYILDEEINNRAYMMASNEGTSWKTRKPRGSWSSQVDNPSHISNMVRLYYCVSNQLGLSCIAAPFNYNYDESFKVVGSVPNPDHKMFFQEESVLAGGFVGTISRANQTRHTDYGNVEYFTASYPDPNIKGAGELLQYGFSVITPLVEGEERVVFIGNSDGHVRIPYNKSLVFLGNVPHGGVTHTISKGSRFIWPALHIHFDIESMSRVIGDLGLVETGEAHMDSLQQISNSKDDFPVKKKRRSDWK